MAISDNDNGDGRLQKKSSGPEAETVWKAIVLTPAPHLTAKSVIDFFVNKMDIAPFWDERFFQIKNEEI